MQTANKIVNIATYRRNPTLLQRTAMRLIDWRNNVVNLLFNRITWH